MTLTRRKFLACLSAAGMGTLATGWIGGRLQAMVDEKIFPMPSGVGLERWLGTSCGLCAAGCGQRIRFVDGLPVGIAGNPLDPASGGGLCPAGFSGLWDALSEDRIRSPLARRGERGSGRWEAIGWDRALDTLSARLAALRASRTPERFVVLEGGSDPIRSRWIEHLLASFGSPNHCMTENPMGLWDAAVGRVLGTGGLSLAPDLDRAGAILSFGYELFETDANPVWQSAVWGRLRDPEKESAPPFVYAGPRLSPTGYKADLFLACRPGTEGAVALGLAYALFQESLVDDGNLGSFTSEDISGLRLWLRKKFHPEAVERITGVAPKLLFRVARSMSRNRGIALVGSSPLAGPNGYGTALAVATLNVLLGAFGREGGWVAPPRLPVEMPSRPLPDEIARAGLDRGRLDRAGSGGIDVKQAPGRFWEQLASGGPYAVDTMLITGTNLLRELPDPGRIAKVLSSIPFVAVTASRMNETAEQADLILPEATYLESWGLVISRSALPFSRVGLRQPAFGPLYDSMQFEDIWFELARRSGAFEPGDIPRNMESWVRAAAADLAGAERGIVPNSVGDGDLAAYLEAGGWKATDPAESSGSFWKRLRRSAVWTAMPAGRPSPGELFRAGRASLTGGDGKKEMEKLAGEEVAEKGENGDEVALLLTDATTLWGGRTSGTPLMLEMAAFHQSKGWETVCEINPATAESLGVADGDGGVLSNRKGTIHVRIVTTQKVPPGVAAVLRGLSGTWPKGLAAGRRGNPLELFGSRENMMTGSWILTARARLTRDDGTA